MTGVPAVPGVHVSRCLPRATHPHPPHLAPIPTTYFVDATAGQSISCCGWVCVVCVRVCACARLSGICTPVFVKPSIAVGSLSHVISSPPSLPVAGSHKLGAWPYRCPSMCLSAWFETSALSLGCPECSMTSQRSRLGPRSGNDPACKVPNGWETDACSERRIASPTFGTLRQFTWYSWSTRMVVMSSFGINWSRVNLSRSPAREAAPAYRQHSKTQLPPAIAYT